MKINNTKQKRMNRRQWLLVTFVIIHIMIFIMTPYYVHNIACFVF